MASVNKVILVGNLGRDPESRTFPSGDQVCNVTIATTDKWKDKASGEMREATEWHRLVFNGRLAEIAAQYLRKGSQIYVEGQIRTRKFTDKEGAEKYATDIRVDQLQMLGSRQGQGGPSGGDDDGGYSQGSQGGGGGGSSYGGGRGDGGGASSSGSPSRPPAAAPRAPAPASRQAPAKSSSGFDDMDDDIPF